MSDALKEHFQLLARYNRAANGRLLDACMALSPATLVQPSAAPFETIPRLLEHLLASDEVWLARFAGDLRARFRPGPLPVRPLAEFRVARSALDDRIEAYVGDLSGAELSRVLCVVNSRDEENCAPLSRFLAHMFNHQTHHRAQVQVLLRAASVMGVSLDLHRLMAEPAL